MRPLSRFSLRCPLEVSALKFVLPLFYLHLGLPSDLILPTLPQLPYSTLVYLETFEYLLVLWSNINIKSNNLIRFVPIFFTYLIFN